MITFLVAGLRLLEWFVPVTLRNKHSSPLWPRAEPSDRNWTHNPPNLQNQGETSVCLILLICAQDERFLQDRLQGSVGQKKKTEILKRAAPTLKSSLNKNFAQTITVLPIKELTFCCRTSSHLQKGTPPN